MTKLSIIFPFRCLGRDLNDLMRSQVQRWNDLGAQVIGIYSDETEATSIEGLPYKDLVQKMVMNQGGLFKIDGTSRAQAINEGVKRAVGDVVFIQHPRSVVDPERVFQQVRAQYARDKKRLWGALTHQFDRDFWGYRVTSLYSNHLRGDLRKIYYLDHCLFLSRDLIDPVFPIPEIEIFEDTVLCQRLKKTSSDCIRLKAVSKTSAIRFETNGFWAQSLRNQWLKILFWLGGDHRKMNTVYEKNLELNARQGQSNGNKA